MSCIAPLVRPPAYLPIKVGTLLLLITKNMHEEEYEEGGEDHKHCHHMGGPMKKEFKLAMLEKKEKTLKAELEFVAKMKELIAKMPDGK